MRTQGAKNYWKKITKEEYLKLDGDKKMIVSDDKGTRFYKLKSEEDLIRFKEKKAKEEKRDDRN
jgi:hypothetical protein